MKIFVLKDGSLSGDFGAVLVIAATSIEEARSIAAQVDGVPKWALSDLKEVDVSTPTVVYHDNGYVDQSLDD